MIKVLQKLRRSKKKEDYPHLRGEALSKAIKEAQKDPKFMKEVREFVKITTS